MQHLGTFKSLSSPPPFAREGGTMTGRGQILAVEEEALNTAALVQSAIVRYLH